MKNHNLKSWILATRPWSFPASAMPVVVTIAYLAWSGYAIDWGIGVWTLLNVVLFHAAGNTWSDYHDYIKGVDQKDTIGGLSIVCGEFEAGEIRNLAIALLAIATVSGLLIMACTGLPTLYLGIAGALLTVVYPWMKYHALGDVNIFLTYSLLPMLGTSFVATGEFHNEALWLSVPVGLITVGILHINNTRDTEQDKRAGIKTFAMLIGKKNAIGLYVFEVFFPFAWIVACTIFGIFPYWSLIALLALKTAAGNARQALKATGHKTFEGIDERTAMLQLIFSLLLTVSFFFDTLL